LKRLLWHTCDAFAPHKTRSKAQLLLEQMVESLLNDPQVGVAGGHKLTVEKRGGMQEKPCKTCSVQSACGGSNFTIRDGVVDVIRWTRRWD